MSETVDNGRDEATPSVVGAASLNTLQQCRKSNGGVRPYRPGWISASDTPVRNGTTEPSRARRTRSNETEVIIHGRTSLILFPNFRPPFFRPRCDIYQTVTVEKHGFTRIRGHV